MRNYKIVILGAQCSGKTTLTRHLREHTDLNVVESDEELKRLNGGEYPSDDTLKHKTLLPKIETDVANSESIVFLTSHFDTERLKKAKENGFKIVLLESDLETLKQRNTHRVENEGYDDASKYLEFYLRTYEELKEEGLIDKVVDADQPIEDVAKELDILFI